MDKTWVRFDTVPNFSNYKRQFFYPLMWIIPAFSPIMKKNTSKILNLLQLFIVLNGIIKEYHDSIK